MAKGRRIRIARLSALFCAPAVVAACSGPRASFNSPDPLERTLALAQTARATSLTDREIQELIASLDSVDPAERMLAIRTLERETGQTLGYRHYDPERIREEAVRRWVDWWSTRGGSVADSSAGASE